MIIALYVDNLLIATNSMAFLINIKDQLKQKFNITELGATHLIISIEIICNHPNRTITLSQHCYIQDVCEQYGMADANTVHTPLDPNSPLSTAQSPQTDTEHAEMKSIPYQNLTSALLYAAMAS
jgi:Reverse transcriptase (RNA-dependent DNA polymerase)